MPPPSDNPARPPFLTADLPGVGGQIKAEPGDFLVEEIPLYLPQGIGQHLYVTIEKSGLSTFSAIRKIAQALNISPKRIGYAGQKDAQAITRQTLSIDQGDPALISRLHISNIQVLQVERHTNKLKIGHLAGNRFRIKIRQVAEQALPTAQDILNRLGKKGVPNYFGQQRFGNRNNSHILGELIVRQNLTEFVAEFLGRPQSNESQAIQEARKRVDAGRWDEALSVWPRNFNDERRALETIVKADCRLTDAVFKSLNGKLKSFLVSAFQAHLFNDLLCRRLPHLEELRVGDVAYIHNKGAAFIVEDLGREQPRADRFEISPAGPLFGPKLLSAAGVPGEEEAQVLLSRNLSPASFKVPGVKLRGARRPYRIPLKAAEVWWDDGLMVSFELPPGAYATTVLAEIMK